MYYPGRSRNEKCSEPNVSSCHGTAGRDGLFPTLSGRSANEPDSAVGIAYPSVHIRKLGERHRIAQPDPVGVLLKLRDHPRNLALRSGITHSRVTDARARPAPREWRTVYPAGSLRTWAGRKEKPAVSPIAAQDLVQAVPGLG